MGFFGCFLKACSLLVGPGDDNLQKNHDLHANCFKYKTVNSVSVGGDDSSSAQRLSRRGKITGKLKYFCLKGNKWPYWMERMTFTSWA